MSINRVELTGNLIKDADLKPVNGTAVASFCVAVNDRRKNRNGEWEDYPNFIGCTLFGKRAEALAPMLRKGLKVAVAGKLHYSSWVTGEQKRSKLEVIADDVEFVSPKTERAEDRPVYDDVPF